MSVEGINNSNNNAGLYVAGAGLLGAGAGAAAGYYTRPFLKDGAPTDEFVKKVNNNLVENLGEAEKKQYFDAVETIKKLDEVSNVEELKELCRNNEMLKQLAPLDKLLAEIDAIGFEKAKSDIKEGVQISLDVRDELVKDLIDSSWDKNAKKFVHNADEVTKEGFEAVKKAARSIQGKYAAIYGSIGAAVLGLGALLCCGGKKEQPQNIDA